MVEDGIILGGEGVTIDELLLMSEILEENLRMFYAIRSDMSAKRRGILIYQVAQHLSLGPDINSTYSDFTWLASLVVQAGCQEISSSAYQL